MDEEIITLPDEGKEHESTLDRVIETVCDLHQGELAETFAAKGGTPLGQIIIEVTGESVRVHESENVKIQESIPVSILIIPTVVGG